MRDLVRKAVIAATAVIAITPQITRFTKTINNRWIIGEIKRKMTKKVHIKFPAMRIRFTERQITKRLISKREKGSHTGATPRPSRQALMNP